MVIRSLMTAILAGSSILLPYLESYRTFVSQRLALQQRPGAGNNDDKEDLEPDLEPAEEYAMLTTPILTSLDMNDGYRVRSCVRHWHALRGARCRKCEAYAII
ncbi:hypothetical protein EI94DRAFT_1279401 [Lactarius quietus]|nr:hypothetical protein EI94DRAFT_1279401 [Lactarius quietus]